MDKCKILIADDEQDIRDIVAIQLQRNGYYTFSASNGQEALDEIINSGNSYDLIILDIIMPIMDGIAAAKQIRKHSDCPILFLTAKSSDNDKIKAYDSGADDYLSKPFSSIELLLRVKALLKRYERPNNINTMVIDIQHRSVTRLGKPIKLTDKEYDLLAFLYKNRGKPYSIHDLYENVWNEKYMQSSSNTVMVHILNLRKKLEVDFTNPQLILTVWGKGYCYAEG